MIKKLLCELLAFALLLTLLCGAGLYISSTDALREPIARLTNSSEYDRSASEEMAAHIANVSRADGATKLIIGDSVCWQICDPFAAANSETVIAASNRAATLAGQYMLAAMFLQAHPDATDVTLMLGVESFSAGFDEAYVYSYCAVPFAEADALTLLDDTTRSELAQAFGAPFISKPLVETIDYSPLCKKLYLNALEARLAAQPSGSGGLNGLSVRMLQSLETLCSENGAELHLMAAPMQDTEERRANIAALAEQFRQAGIYERYSDYFENITYYPASLFSDGLHFDYAQCGMEFFAGVLADLQQNTGLLGGLVTSY